MEKLKSVVPRTLKRKISESTPHDLPSTCSSLLDFFLPLQLFQKVVRDLTDPETALFGKNKDAALDSKQKGNECFSTGDYAKALSFYSQALRFAPMGADDVDANLVATLFVNRACSLHKMGFLVESLRDCNRAVVLSPSYAKAWYRRGKANASLENYEDAIRDLNIAMNMELAVGGKRRIKNELELILDQCKRTSNSFDVQNEKNSCSFVVPHQIKLQCVSTPTKGRGMASLSDIPQASLVHSEEPYAAIVLKHCRETHCHFCLNELPADLVPCSSCSTPVYCSQHCQVQAGGPQLRNNPNSYSSNEIISRDVEKYIADITLANSGYAAGDANIEHIAEHRHECGGVNWPAILPSEIVLAGRVLVKSIEQRNRSKGAPKTVEVLELSHNYVRMPPESKLELHIYSIVLAYCIKHYRVSEFELTGDSASQLVILLSQIKVNSMAVVHMKSTDAYRSLEQPGRLSPTEGALTSNVEQVRVGQAIYSTGSLFNHSCQPNIHAYFLSRTLLIRTTEFVASKDPLELSYGPQVGQWDLKDRQKLLEDQYSFKCRCSGCLELNLSDLVINAFRCAKPNCFGTVLDSCMANHEGHKILQGGPTNCSLERHIPVDELKREDINKVAHLLFERTNDALQNDPGYCLKCGSYRDLKSSHATAKKAGSYIKRLRDAITLKEVSKFKHSDAVRSLDLMRSTMHAYSKNIAEAEDNLAEAFCLVGEFQLAMDHCKASIEILEKLYHANHIVIGNELVKLASIQLSLGDRTSAMDSINRLDAIFSLYYGSHAAKIFPYLECLGREARKLAQQRGPFHCCSSSPE